MLNILIVLGAILHLTAQGGFNMVVENPLFIDNGMRFDHINLTNDTITIAGTYADDSIGASGVIVAQFDTVGNMIHMVTVTDTAQFVSLSTNPGRPLLKSSDGGYAVPAVRSNHAMMIKLTASLEVEFVSEFELNDRIMVPSQVIEEENGYLILGWIQRVNGNLMMFVIKVDRDGNEVWRKYYGHPSFNQAFGGVVISNAGEIIIGSVIGPPFNAITPEEDKRSKPWMFSIDGNGELIWQWVGDEYDGGARAIWNLKKTSDGGYVYNTGFRHLIDDDNSLITPLLIKRDSLMNLVWERDYDEGPLSTWSYFADLQILPNDEIVMAGVRGKRYDGVPAIVGRVVKASDTGEQTWEATDTGLWSVLGWSESIVTGMAVSQTGSIYTCGRTRTGGFPQGWLIKVTADGCIDTLCMTTSLTDLIQGDEQEFNIYPNPSQGRFTIEAGQQTGDFVFTLYDTYGRLVEQERFDYATTISVSSGTPPGIYVYAIRDALTGRQLQSGKLVIE